MKVTSTCCACSSASFDARSRRTLDAPASSSPTPASGTGGCSAPRSLRTESHCSCPRASEPGTKSIQLGKVCKFWAAMPDISYTPWEFTDLGAAERSGSGARAQPTTPADGNALICCAQPTADVILDL